MNSEPANVKFSSPAKPAPMVSKTTRPQSVRNTIKANRICKPMPIPTTRQLTAFRFVESAYAMAVSTRSPNTPLSKRIGKDMWFSDVDGRRQPLS